MAGKNQHHVWQLIQRGFGEKRGKHHHIWVYQKGQKPKQTSTRKYGVKPFYLSEGSDNTADDTLTTYENSIQSQIQKIRSAADGTKLEPKFIASFITHLEMRSLFLREEMSYLGQKVLARLQEILGNEREAAELMLSYWKNKPELLDAELAKHNIPDEIAPTIKAMLEAKGPTLIKEQSPHFAEMAKNLLTPLIQRIPDVSKKAHIKSFGGGFSEIEKTNSHLRLSYRFCKSKDNIILPDTGIVFFKRNGLAPFSQKGDNITDLIAPLGSDSYIYGFRSEVVQRSGQTINSALASCSYNSFIARDNRASFRKQSNKIGKNAKLISDSELKKIISFENLLA